MNETRWLLRLSDAIAVTVVVHTTDAKVVANVERAAAANGLALERLEVSAEK